MPDYRHRAFRSNLSLRSERISTTIAFRKQPNTMEQREIKFRAYHELQGMHHAFQFIRSGNEPSDWIVFISDKHPLSNNRHPFEDPYPAQSFKIMQYTGLKDKNGKEIYEGDMIEAKHWAPMGYVVEFIEGGYCLTNPNLKGLPIDIDLMYSSLGCACEVIGNIYESTEPAQGIEA